MESVRTRGVNAVVDYSLKFDGARLDSGSIAVRASEFAAAEQFLPSEQKKAMLEMKKRLEDFAKLQKRSLGNVVQKTKEGSTSLVFKPLSRVGIYVPAGRAPLFSSLFMAALPAQAAGVDELIVCTPPQKDGKANSFILAAAKMCGISKVYKIGGAQAIAAMAFGLDGLLEPADIICGPGNSYVNAAKMEAAGRGIRIDVPAGPSEVLVIADKSAIASFVAADMLAQAEHGSDSAAICICTNAKTAAKVEDELARQLALLPSDNPAQKSIPKWARIWVANSVDEAVEAANSLACEHLELMVKGAPRFIPKIRNAGAIFVRTAEAFCDYGMSGGNHILPTGSAARAWGGVSVQTFGKWVYVDEIFETAQKKLARQTALLARMEGLEAHARAAEKRETTGKRGKQ